MLCCACLDITEGWSSGGYRCKMHGLHASMSSRALDTRTVKLTRASTGYIKHLRGCSVTSQLAFCTIHHLFPRCSIPHFPIILQHGTTLTCPPTHLDECIVALVGSGRRVHSIAACCLWVRKTQNVRTSRQRSPSFQAVCQASRRITIIGHGFIRYFLIRFLCDLPAVARFRQRCAG